MAFAKSELVLQNTAVLPESFHSAVGKWTRQLLAAHFEAS